MGKKGQYVYLYRNERLNLKLVDAWKPKGETPCGDDPELFWSPLRKKMREAAALCMQCPEIQECKAAAHAQGEETHVWGGELPIERMEEVKRRERMST